jgi:hypothetical protein
MDKSRPKYSKDRGRFLNDLDASPLGKNIFILLAVIANHASLDWRVFGPKYLASYWSGQ